MVEESIYIIYKLTNIQKIILSDINLLISNNKLIEKNVSYEEERHNIHTNIKLDIVGTYMCVYVYKNTITDINSIYLIKCLILYLKFKWFAHPCHECPI